MLKIYFILPEKISILEIIQFWWKWKGETSCGWAGPSSAKLGLRWAKLVGCWMRANISHDTVKNQPHFMLRWVQLLLVLPKYTITGVWVGEWLAGKGKNFILIIYQWKVKILLSQFFNWHFKVEIQEYKIRTFLGSCPLINWNDIFWFWMCQAVTIWLQISLLRTIFSQIGLRF